MAVRVLSRTRNGKHRRVLVDERGLRVCSAVRDQVNTLLPATRTAVLGTPVTTKAADFGCCGCC